MRDNEQQEQSTFESFRRDVLKAVGAGSALGIFGGTAAANGAGGRNQMDEDEATDEEQTVHTVRTLIQPSTNPERPADFFFQPTGLSIDTGDTVEFVFETPDHTVTSYHPAFGMQRRIPPGVEAFSSPIMGWDPDSLPADIDMPPAEDGTIGGDGEMPDNGTETPTSDDGMETPTTDEEDTETTPPAVGGETDENGTSAPGGNDTEAPGDNETDGATGSATDTVATADENAQVTPEDGGTETPSGNGTATPGDDGIGTPSENGTETPSDGERTPTDGAEDGAETPGAGEGGMAEPSVWRREFDTAGVYDLECAPHETYGMAMRIVVGEETNPAFETSDIENLPEPRVGPVGLAREVLTDVELEPGAIVEAGQVMWEDLQTYNEPGEDEAPGEGEPGEETPSEETQTDDTPEEVTPDEESAGGGAENGTSPGNTGNESMAENESESA